VDPLKKERDRQIFLEALEKDFARAYVEFVRDKVQAEPQRVRHKSRLDSPKISDVEARIDLHGMTRERARNALELFLKVCISKNRRCVLIVHGKGTGRVKEEVFEILNHHTRVSHFRAAPAKLGGHGATIAVLK